MIQSNEHKFVEVPKVDLNTQKEFIYYTVAAYFVLIEQHHRIMTND